MRLRPVSAFLHGRCSGDMLLPLVLVLCAAPLSGQLAPLTRYSEVELRNLVELPAADFLPDLADARLLTGRTARAFDPAADPLVGNSHFRHLLRRTPGVLLMEEEVQGAHFHVGFRGVPPNNGLFAQVLQNGFPLHVDVFGTRLVAAMPDINQVAQLQVVTGGTGLLAGPQPGGMINLLSYAPAGDQPLRVRNTATLGSHGYASNVLEASGTQGEFSYGAFGRYAEGDGFGVQPAFDNTSAGVLLARRFGDRAAVTLSLQGYWFSSEAISGVARATSGVNNLLNYYFQEVRRIAAEGLFEYDFSRDSRLESRVWYHATDGERDFTPTGQLGFTTDRIRYAGTDTRVTWRYGTAATAGHVLTAGFTVQGADSDLVSAPSTLGTNRLDLDRRDFNWAVRAENKFQLHDRFSATLGLRYEHAELEGRGFRGTGDVDRRFRDREWLYSAGIEADLLPPRGLTKRPLVFTAHVGTGYRPPTYNETVNQGFGTVVPAGLESASLRQFEVGLRSQPHRWFRTGLTAFWLEFDDQFATVSGVVANAGSTEHRGVEWFQEVDVLGWLGGRNDGANPAPRLGPRSPGTETGLARFGRLSVFSAVSRLDTEIVRSPFVGAVGVDVPYAPRWNASGGVAYNHFERIKAVLSARYVSSHLGNINNDDQLLRDNRAARIPTYVVWDAAFEWSVFRDRLTLFANLNNVLDREYISGIQGGTAAGNRIVALGRNVYAGARLTF